MTTACHNSRGACDEPASSSRTADTASIYATPVALSWIGDDDGQTRYLGLDPASGRDSISFELHHNASLCTAFFKLRVNMAVRSRRDKINIFMFIPPEHIRSLALLDNDDDDDDHDHDHDGDNEGGSSDKAGSGPLHVVADALGRALYQLRFQLDVCPALVMPKDDVEPKQTAMHLMMNLQALAGQASFSVYLPATAMPRAQLLRLCEAVSTPVPSSRPRSIQALADLSSLYGGKGGRAVEQAKPPPPASTSAAPGDDQGPPLPLPPPPPPYHEDRKAERVFGSGEPTQSISSTSTNQGYSK